MMELRECGTWMEFSAGLVFLCGEVSIQTSIESQRLINTCHTVERKTLVTVGAF